jgi:hypothetical protein
MTSQESNGQTSDRRIHQALNARPLLLSNQLKLITFCEISENLKFQASQSCKL